MFKFLTSSEFSCANYHTVDEKSGFSIYTCFQESIERGSYKVWEINMGV